MSWIPSGWQMPKTNWLSNDIPLPDDFNRIEGNTLAIQGGIYLPNRRKLAMDETERSVVGVTPTIARTIRLINSPTNGYRFANIRVCLEMRVTAGTGTLTVLGNGATLFTLITSSATYVLMQGSAAVAWLNDSINVLDLQLQNSGANTTFFRTLEIYADIAT